MSDRKSVKKVNALIEKVEASTIPSDETKDALAFLKEINTLRGFTTRQAQDHLQAMEEQQDIAQQKHDRSQSSTSSTDDDRLDTSDKLAYAEEKLALAQWAAGDRDVAMPESNEYMYTETISRLEGALAKLTITPPIQSSNMFTRTFESLGQMMKRQEEPKLTAANLAAIRPKTPTTN